MVSYLVLFLPLLGSLACWRLVVAVARQESDDRIRSGESREGGARHTAGGKSPRYERTPALMASRARLGRVLLSQVLASAPLTSLSHGAGVARKRTAGYAKLHADF